MTTPRVEVAITIRAARERVFDAWLDPARLARFLCAGGTHVARIEIDAREGGQFRVVMASDRGEYDHRGQYLEIARPERLRFTWTSAATHGLATDVTVIFEEIDDGTRVTLVHTGLPDQTAATEYAKGWQSILQKCRDAVLADTTR
ncbi:MAG TPA: SRPBCC domain-containing protein [Vicinamibacterales bacterium]|nr:SRPBCC domain-containing protein [Vicinamibacterales bacterium]